MKCPKYTHGNRVSFLLGGKKQVGTVCVVDRYDLFGEAGPNYDVVSHSDHVLYKHIPESMLFETNTPIWKMQVKAILRRIEGYWKDIKSKTLNFIEDYCHE